MVNGEKVPVTTESLKSKHSHSEGGGSSVPSTMSSSSVMVKRESDLDLSTTKGMSWLRVFLVLFLFFCLCGAVYLGYTRYTNKEFPFDGGVGSKKSLGLTGQRPNFGASSFPM